MAALPHAHPMTMPSSRLSPALRYMESAKLGGTMTATMLRSKCWLGANQQGKMVDLHTKERGLAHRVRRLRCDQKSHSRRERDTAPYPCFHGAS